jgi:hypothetical protein
MAPYNNNDNTENYLGVNVAWWYPEELPFLN